MYKRVLSVIPNIESGSFAIFTELRNRYMVVNAPEGLVAEPVRPVNRTSAEQLAVQVTEQVRSVGII